MGNLKKLASALDILSRKSKVLLLAAAILRIGLNFLDLAALAVVGIVAYLAANPTKFFTMKLSEFSTSFQFSISDVPWLAIAAAALFLCKSFFSIIFSFQFGSKISQLEAQYSTKWIFNHFEFTNPEDVYPDTPLVHTTLMRSMSSLITGILTSLVTLLSESALLALLVLGFLFLNPFAATLVVIYLGIIVAVMSLIILPRIQLESSNDYAASHKMLTITRDYLANRKAILMHGENSRWLEELAEAKTRQITSANKGLTLTSLPRNLIETALILGVFGFLGIVVVFSDIPTQAVTIGVFLVGGLRLISAILPLQASVSVIRQSLAAVDTALEGLKLDSPHPNLHEERKPRNFDITVEDMTLEIQNSNFKLDRISLNIPFGEKIAIVGPSGAGKTTLGEVILGLRHPNSGRVEIGGVRVQDILNGGQQHFAYVPQQPQLIEGSVAENVSLSRNPDVKACLRALDLAGLSKLVEGLPEGIETNLVTSDRSLSGGELQRLGLARALYTDSEVILLDEATSALDAGTEELISNTLLSFKGKKTMIVIAHRLSTIVDADCIVYLNRGKVLGQGKYEELLKVVPDFARAAKLLGSDDASRSSN